MKRLLSLFLLLVIMPCAFAEKKILNIYAWASEIPDNVIRQFEKETGIKVNFSTYENNEIMYAKIRASKNAGYDVVIPSSYFVDRMRRQNMLTKLDKTKLPNWKNLSSDFLNPAYDPGAQYCMPFLWGITGIFFNKNYYPEGSIKKWSDLWDARFQDKLMLLDDTREVFSMGLLSLGYSPNDSNPDHIKEAFLKLKTLMQNVKVFSSDTVVSILIDEDATVGMAWNGDVFKAAGENSNLRFVFPEEGFVIWVDNFVIPVNAPHKDNAYTFLNFILRPEIGKIIGLYTRFPITNAAGQALLPDDVRNNPFIYPSKEILKRGVFQTDLGEKTLGLYERYWEELKMSG